MNYCCANGNCDACIQRYAAIRAQARVREQRLRRFGPKPPSPPQLKIVDEVVRSLKTIDANGDIQKPTYWSPRADS